MEVFILMILDILKVWYLDAKTQLNFRNAKAKKK